jgi:deoxyribose-phosphate aldolase
MTVRRHPLSRPGEEANATIQASKMSVAEVDALRGAGRRMSHSTLMPDPSALPLRGRERGGPVEVRAVARNEAQALEMGWLDEIRINLSATERRVATLPGRRTVKNEAQAAWLLKAISCIDLTTLNGDDTAGRVKRLCAKARVPVRADILVALGLADRALHTGCRNRGRSARRFKHSRRGGIGRIPVRARAARSQA